MAKTRSMTRRRMPSSGAKKSYRRRVKASSCRGKSSIACNVRSSGCTMSRGKKRSFCRKSKNTRRARRT